MSKLILDGFSHNFRYVFTNQGIFSLSENLNDLNGRNIISYSYENLNIGIEILKENIEYKFKTKQINLLEYTNYSRKFLYELLEIFKPINQIKILKEWEDMFGNNLLIINESTDNFTTKKRIDESWNSLKYLIEQWYNSEDWVKATRKGLENVYSYGKEKSSAVWNKIKDSIQKTGTCLSNDFFYCFMEGLRSVVLSAPGIAVLTGAEFIPVVGQIPTLTIFGSLLIWDLYKMISGKYESNFGDIIIDSISLLLPALGAMVKPLIGPIRSAAEFGSTAIVKGGILGKVFNIIKNNIPKLVQIMESSAEWIYQKTGIKFLKNVVSKVSSKLKNIVDEMVKSADNAISTKVSSMNQLERKEYEKLLTQWQEKQKLSGKSNLKPGQGTRSNLVDLAKKNVKSGDKLTLKKIGQSYLPKAGSSPSIGKVVKVMGKNFVITTGLCVAMGLDGVSCTEKNVTEKLSNMSPELQDKLIQNAQTYDFEEDTDVNQK
jgi:hypothetical protein